MVELHIVLQSNALIQSTFGLRYVGFSLLVFLKKILYVFCESDSFLWIRFAVCQGSLRIYDTSEDIISISSSLWDSVDKKYFSLFFQN